MGMNDPETRELLTVSETLRADLFRYRARTDTSAFISDFTRDPGFRFTFCMPKVGFYSRRKQSPWIIFYALYRIFYNRYRFRFGFDISPKTLTGPGLHIGHFGGIVISPHAVIGFNVNIAQGVTIGAASRGERAGAPTLEDRVWVGANAIIVGKIPIGHDALIAPGAYVNFDVPAMSVILGNPGTIISHSGSIGYVNHILALDATDTAS
jgi:serine O-acetyltransferase